MHTCGSSRGSVTGVVESWILTVPLSPFLMAPAALEAAMARVRPAIMSAMLAKITSFARQATVATQRLPYCEIWAMKETAEARVFVTPRLAPGRCLPTAQGPASP